MFKFPLTPNVLRIVLPDHDHSYGPAVIPGNIGRRVKRTVVNAASYTVLPSDEYVVATENCTVTLPPASSVPEGWMLIVANPMPASITVGVTPSGTDGIGGVNNSISLSSTFGMTMLVSDGVDNYETVTPALALM